MRRRFETAGAVTIPLEEYQDTCFFVLGFWIDDDL